MNIIKSVTARIKYFLNQRNMSVYRLTKLTGLSENALFLIIHEKTNDIKLSSLMLIVNALQVSLSEFFASELFENLDD